MRWILAFLLLMFFSMPVLTQETLFSFQKGANGESWDVMNDGVMGGKSEGSYLLYSSYGKLRGTISLDNNGGFSSLRSPIGDYDLSKYDGLVVRIRGDGRTYNMVFRQTRHWRGVSYYYFFPTRRNVWMDVVVPFDRCKGYFFGKSFSVLGTMDPEKVKQVGIMLFDKLQGGFEIDLAWIKGYKNP